MKRPFLPDKNSIGRFSLPDPNDEYIISQIALWKRVMNPDTKFYFVMQKEDGILCLTTEDAEESWIDFIIRAYFTQQEAFEYATEISTENEEDLAAYHIWSASIEAICDTIPIIIGKKKTARVELHKLYGGKSECIDILWDNITN